MWTGINWVDTIRKKRDMVSKVEGGNDETKRQKLQSKTIYWRTGANQRGWSRDSNQRKSKRKAQKWGGKVKIDSVQFSCSVMSNSLWPHRLQHTRPPCPSPTPGVHPNSCPLSRWCHPTISSSVVPFYPCPQSFPTSRSFQMSQLFTSGGQSIGVSASTSVLPMNTQDWSSLGWTDWISLQSTGLSRVFSNTTVQKPQFFVLSFLYGPTLTSIHVRLLEKLYPWLERPLLAK